MKKAPFSTTHPFLHRAEWQWKACGPPPTVFQGPQRIRQLYFMCYMPPIIHFIYPTFTPETLKWNTDSHPDFCQAQTSLASAKLLHHLPSYHTLGSMRQEQLVPRRFIFYCCGAASGNVTLNTAACILHSDLKLLVSITCWLPRADGSCGSKCLESNQVEEGHSKAKWASISKSQSVITSNWFCTGQTSSGILYPVLGTTL